MGAKVRRAAVSGLVTAAALGLIGAGFGELAALALAAGGPDRAVPVAAAGPPEPHPLGESLRARLPWALAGWGFVLAAGGELLWASRRKTTPVAPREPDPAEQLLDQLLREAEAKATATRDNTRTPEPVPGAPGSGG